MTTTDFSNLYFVSHQPGTVGDSLVAFLSMHCKTASFNIVGNRMRSATPGILLNWGYYYKNWPLQQQDPNLYKAIDLTPGVSNFAQAHFFLQEHQLLKKFPGCKTIQLTVSDDANFDTYWRWLYHKLLNKRMHRAWHDRYLKFAKLRDPKTQATLAKMCKDGTLRVKHYWTAWYVDNLGMDLHLVPNPFEYWLGRKYVTDFHPNLPSMIVNNAQAKSLPADPNVIRVDIDQLWPLDLDKMNLELYQELCDKTGLVPDFDLAHRFWTWWRGQQPDAEQIVVSSKWL